MTGFNVAFRMRRDLLVVTPAVLHLEFSTLVLATAHNGIESTRSITVCRSFFTKV
jgi:hypothetical protein